MPKGKIHKSDSPPVPLVDLSYYDLIQIWNTVRAGLGFRELRNVNYTRTHLIRLINRDYKRLEKRHGSKTRPRS